MDRPSGGANTTVLPDGGAMGSFVPCRINVSVVVVMSSHVLVRFAPPLATTAEKSVG